MSIYIGATELKSLKKGTSDISEVYVGGTKVRPSKDERTFTITWQEKSDMSSGWTYSDDAAGLTAGSSEFDKFFGYYGCRLSDAGAETAKVQQSGGNLDITQLGTLTSGDNVMIAFPLRGIKMSKNGSYVTLSITAKPNQTGYQYIAFMDNGVIKDKLYVGVYEGSDSSGKIKSLSGVTPAQYSLDGAVSAANAYGSGTRYHIATIYTRWYLTALYMMKYGNPQVRNVIGKGLTSMSGVSNTGLTNSYTSASWGGTDTQPCKLFGLENFWGNKCEVVDGALWVNTSSNINTSTTQAFPSSGRITSLDYSSGASIVSFYGIQTIVGDNQGMFAPLTGTGKYVYTNYGGYTYSNWNYSVAMGGRWEYDRDGPGLFYYSGGYNTGSSDKYQGARLIYI